MQVSPQQVGRGQELFEEKNGKSESLYLAENANEWGRRGIGLQGGKGDGESKS